MKYIFVFLLSSTMFAKAIDECYSIQLKSFYIKQNSSYSFRNQNYPDSCKLITISGMSSVRCGCYEYYSDAQSHLRILSEDYYDAIIVNTYKRRFNHNTKHKNYTFKNTKISYSRNRFRDDADKIDEIELDDSTYLDEYGYK